MEESLRRAWHELLAPFGARPAEADEAIANVSAALRAARRLAAVLEQLDRLDHRTRNPVAVRLAAWAAAVAPEAWPERQLAGLGVPTDVLADASRLRAVANGQEPAEDDDDASVLSDAHLAVLGAGERDYARYVEELREQRGRSDETWCAARYRAVRDLLDRDTIFRTPEMRASHEGRAQLNLAREAAALGRALRAHRRR